ncbi:MULTISPECIES: hypothetical protein [unclassified Bradyrhizobium]|jgi:hypothetical protein|uniref:hypothetical protein n=1 Tax=unclassified Bradyrhizobium TaxID=2631580 RepID=UPI001FF8C395|nr:MULTISPECIES: hypothetical protein [unclassified Bradyrhizobium]MCK1537504.1 hypothetical protein [Bradyrhizobium sp. 176]MCK1554892.1 hypothetical protein [Bradyrhizobium sp. 171]MCK1573376.1 hypothetical protein [Bradyrhizobium sp. 174]
MESGTSTNVQQIERNFLAAFEPPLAATAGIVGRAKELALALKHLVERQLLRRAGEDPIPGSAIAFRLVRPTSPDRLAKAKDQPRPEAIAQRSAAK